MLISLVKNSSWSTHHSCQDSSRSCRLLRELVSTYEKSQRLGKRTSFKKTIGVGFGSLRALKLLLGHSKHPLLLYWCLWSFRWTLRYTWIGWVLFSLVQIEPGLLVSQWLVSTVFRQIQDLASHIWWHKARQLSQVAEIYSSCQKSRKEIKLVLVNANLSKQLVDPLSLAWTFRCKVRFPRPPRVHFSARAGSPATPPW